MLREKIPLLSAALVTIYVGAVLGSALNDSGAIVGGLVFFTLSGALVVRGAGSDMTAA